jgi:hypothetical protein
VDFLLPLEGLAAVSDLDSSPFPVFGSAISCRTEERGVAVGLLLPVMDCPRVGFGEAATGVRLGEGDGVRLAAAAGLGDALALALGDAPAVDVVV